MDVSIILVNYNGGGVLKTCLESLARTSFGVSTEVIVVDNASTDGSVDGIDRSLPRLKLIRNSSNRGFGHGCNTGARAGIGKFLLFLNPDTRVENDILTPQISYLDRHPDVGVMGPLHRYEDGAFQLTAGVLPSIPVEMMDKMLYFFHRRRFRPVNAWLQRRFSTTRNVQWVAGACMLIRRDLFQALDGYDEQFFLYFEDKDLCLRARQKGFRVVFFSDARITHLLGRSSQELRSDHLRKIYRESQKYYYRKHHGRFQQLLLKAYHAAST